MIFIGDIHGNWNQLHDVISAYTDTNFVQVGDFGLGFADFRDDFTVLEEFNQLLVNNRSYLYVVRGNHDNPSYWNLEFSNIYLMDDYSTANIEGRDVLFIGGGVSLDRCRRVENHSWWRNETIKPIDKKYECDILVTHVPLKTLCKNIKLSPTFLKTWCDLDANLSADIEKEHNILREIHKNVKCWLWVSGHLHVSGVTIHKQFTTVVLDTYEIFGV